VAQGFMCQKEGTSPLVAIKIGVVLTQIRFLRGKISEKVKREVRFVYCLYEEQMAMREIFGNIN